MAGAKAPCHEKGKVFMKERYKKYVAICERAENMGISKSDRTSSLMDIESADLKFNLRLDEWLKADDYNFTHDFLGIYANIDREGGFPAKNFGFFVPRFSSPASKEK